MKMKSCVWLVCALSCIIAVGKVQAQVVTVENGFSITSMKNAKLGMNKVYPYQMSVGMLYMDKGWYNLSSNIGYTRRGGQEKIIYSPTGEQQSHIIYKNKLHYLTISTTFDVKKISHDGYTFFLGVGPRLDFKLKAVETTYTDFKDDVNEYEPTKQNLHGYHPVLFGLKCVGGIRKDFGNMQLGFNIAYLPSFTRLISGVRDKTFTFGLSLGYRLGSTNEKDNVIHSVRQHR